jgi:methyl-galactoside transport system substrate-binding protein
MCKRFASLILTVILAFFVLVGCGDIKSSSENTGAKASVQGPYADKKVGICIYSESDRFMELFRRELVDYLSSKGFSDENIIVFTSENNQDIQIDQVRKLINEDVDAMIINPVNEYVVHYITDIAISRKIPLVYINREPSANEEAKWEDYNLEIAYVGCDARQSGILQGELLLGVGERKLDINNDGYVDYFMLEGAPENIDAAYRTAYSVSSLKSSGVNLRCLMQEVANWDRTTARLQTYKTISAGKVPEVIICNNDAMALGAKDAVLELGLKPGENVYIVGVDGLPEALESVMDGSFVGTVFNDFISQSHNAADAAINYIDGRDNEHFIGCDYIKVTSSNAKQYLELVDTN